jgi:hypothetical protein
MTKAGDRFRDALDALEISPDRFAELAGVHRTSVFRWCSTAPPKWAQWLVTLLLERRRLANTLTKLPPAE